MKIITDNVSITDRIFFLLWIETFKLGIPRSLTAGLFIEENKIREVNGLLEALKIFKLKEGLILTNDQMDEINIEDKKILVKPVWKWLLEIWFLIIFIN